MNLLDLNMPNGAERADRVLYIHLITVAKTRFIFQTHTAIIEVELKEILEY